MQAKDITQSQVEEYAQTGVVKIPNVISPEEAAHYRKEAIEILEAMPTPESAADYRRPFHQRVNIWRENEVLRPLTLHANVPAAAERLAGTPLRLRHDHILGDEPGADQNRTTLR